MKRLISILIVLLLPAMLFAGETYLPNGLVIGDTADSPDVTVGNDDLYIKGTLEVDGAITSDGNITLDGKIVNEANSSVINLSTSSELTITDRFMLIRGSNTINGVEGFTSDATPFISTTAYTQGTIVTLMGVSDNGYMTISDNGTVSGSLLELDGTTYDLQKYDNITLMLYDNRWVQVGGTNNID